MTYLILDLNDELLDVIDFGTEADKQAYEVANPEHVLELTDTIDEIYGLDDEEEADEWWR